MHMDKDRHMDRDMDGKRELNIDRDVDGNMEENMDMETFITPPVAAPHPVHRLYSSDG